MLSRRVLSLAALNLFILSPLLAYELRLAEGGPDRTFLFVFPLSLLSLTFLHVATSHLRALHLLLLPFYLAVAVDDFVIWQYDTRLASSMLLVLVENVGDAGEYVGAHAFEVFGALGLFLTLYVLAIVGLGSAPWRARPRTAAATLVALAALVLGVGVKIAGLGVAPDWTFYGGTNLASLDRSLPFGVLSQSWVTYTVYRQAVAARRASENFRFGARRERTQEQSSNGALGSASAQETYLLVIGESSRRDHWSLYGYHRPTTPQLDALENLVVFKNVLSQAALTAISVPLILTRGSIERPSRASGERSIVSAMHEAGFATYWLSTQSRDHYTGAINRYSAEGDRQRYYERRHDGVLNEAFRELVLADAARAARKFAVLHTMGSHYTYENRYPREFERFPVVDRVGRESMINAYDNTVLYMDHVLAQIIADLQQKGGIAALLYVSDHAENLLDDERNLFGHLVPTEYDVPVPMFVWLSDSYKERYPERVAAARANVDRPINTRSIFYSLLALASTTIDDPQLARLSVFSSKLTAPTRMVSGPKGTFDFDAWSRQSERAMSLR
jgi:heptose-I-phosphate ethanolaminephosphotransferase